MTSREVHIRDATPEDARAMAVMLGQLGYPTPEAEIPQRLAIVLEQGGRVVLAVDNDDSPLGLLCLTRHSGIHANGPTAYINALVIAEGARRRGVGNALVTFAKKWGIDNGAEAISVTSAEHRDGAHAFYPAMGLPYTGRRFSAKLTSDS
jgi:GNAT superfamily N-acetyltransferase